MFFTVIVIVTLHDSNDTTVMLAFRDQIQKPRALKWAQNEMEGGGVIQ